MRNTVLSYLLLPLLGLSFSLQAAPPSTNLPATEVTAPSMGMASDQPGTATLDLNSADAGTLQRELNGIGKAKAEAIVAYRDANGPFTSVDELLEIKGIGNALLERNRDKLMIK
ncbi:helix-hairpin-helix domain-containing protein [Pseudomonas xanthosomatis]|uniref:ComEA family DNA-binding protein n=1 Tax=Pseudomonas xanthosomatis TaxID=2842356 RepID=UPI001C3D7E7C|nr:helix-hairpin-helix domain-containing protein [Pseudomonas xanthosomatis]QXH48322.1 helix-hairpin-helix domain-containing protein [Pseudomonas xanthosomatis]